MSDDAARILHSCDTIARHWHSMLPTAPRTVRWGTIGRTDTRPLAVPAHILDARRETAQTLASWALVVAEDRDLHTGLDGGDAPALARFLATHSAWLGDHEAGPDAAEEIERHARRVLGIVQPPPPLEFVGPCECGGDLRARPGEAATCRECGTTINAELIRAILVEQAKDRLLTATELVALAPRLWDVPVSKQRVDRLAKSGALPRHGAVSWGDRRLALYRVGDLDDVVARSARRAG